MVLRSIKDSFLYAAKGLFCFVLFFEHSLCALTVIRHSLFLSLLSVRKFRKWSRKRGASCSVSASTRVQGRGRIVRGLELDAGSGVRIGWN